METSFQSTTGTAGFRQHIGIWAAWVCLFLELAELVFAHCAAAFKPSKPTKTRYVPPRHLQLEDEGDTQVNSLKVMGASRKGSWSPSGAFLSLSERGLLDSFRAWASQPQRKLPRPYPAHSDSDRARNGLSVML